MPGKTPTTEYLRGVGPVLNCGACGARLTLRPIDQRWGCSNLCCRHFLNPASPAPPRAPTETAE